MNKKYRPVLPIEHQDDVLYEEPTPEVFAAVKEEKAKRGTFKKTFERRKGKSKQERVEKEAWRHNMLMNM